MAWPWSDGLGCEHLALLVSCETETKIAHLFMKELGHGQVGWDVVSLGLQGFLVPALSLLGLASLHVHLTWTNQPSISLYLSEQINQSYPFICLNKSTNHITILFDFKIKWSTIQHKTMQCGVFFFSQIHCTWQKLRRTKNDG